jgi:hypothetical protein
MAALENINAKAGVPDCIDEKSKLHSQGNALLRGSFRRDRLLRKGGDGVANPLDPSAA